jgi:hypothetical protein
MGRPARQPPVSSQSQRSADIALLKVPPQLLATGIGRVIDPAYRSDVLDREGGRKREDQVVRIPNLDRLTGLDDGGIRSDRDFENANRAHRAALRRLRNSAAITGARTATTIDPMMIEPTIDAKVLITATPVIIMGRFGTDPGENVDLASLAVCRAADATKLKRRA